VLGEKTGLGGSWVGVVLLAATTSLPELFTGFGATALAALPDIAVGDVLGSCMFNLLTLSFMDAIQPEPLSTRAHQGHALSIGFGLVLIGVAGLGLLGGARIPPLGWIGLYSPVFIAVYFVSMRLIFTHEQQRRARETQEVATELQYGAISLHAAVLHYTVAAVLVVAAALWLPRLGAELARQTGLGEAFVGSLFIAITTSLPEIVVSLAAVRIGAIDLGIGNVLGSNLFNLLILGLDDVFYRQGPLLMAADASHGVTVLAVVIMNALFLVGLTYRVLTKRFAVAWDTGAMAAVYVTALTLAYLLRS
jgi:cation:H+ antiporter